MLWAIQWNPDVLLAMAACLTAAGGIFATLASVRMKKMEQKHADDEDCYHKLKLAREEAESASSALHEIRMKEIEEDK